MPVTAARCWDRLMSEAGRIPTFLGLMLQKGRQRVNESTEMCEILPGRDEEIDKNKAGWGDRERPGAVWGAVLSHSVVSDSCNPMDCVAHQAPLSMESSRQEYWSGLPFPSPGDLPNPGIKPGSPAFQADALTSEPPGKPRYMHIKGAYSLEEKL